MIEVLVILPSISEIKTCGDYLSRARAIKHKSWPMD